VQAIELRSPVRVADQYVLWDRHYDDAGTDFDGDGKPDALDTAAYARVIGQETVTLPNLPPQRAVRVDTTQLVRVTFSSNGKRSEVIRGVQQTWYAAGVGIVRRTTAVPSEIRGDTVTDEWLVSWDGIGTGLGALPPSPLLVPQGNPVHAGLQLKSDFRLKVFGMPDHVLLLQESPDNFLQWIASTMDVQGRITATRLIPGWRPTTGQWAASGDRVIWLEEAGLTQLQLTVLDARGMPIGAPGGLTIDLLGGHVSGRVTNLDVALDGQTMWLLFDRSYHDPAPGQSPSSELVLRPYDLKGQPLAPEMLIDGPQARVHTLSAAHGRALIAWERDLGGSYGWRYAVATTAGAGMVRSLISGYSEYSTYVRAVSLQDHDLLNWFHVPGLEASTGFGGLLLGPQQQALRAGPSWASEGLVDFATGEAPELAWAGNRLVLSRREPLGEYLGSQPVVRWIDIDGKQALAAAPVIRVSSGAATEAIRAAIVREDRLLLITGDYRLSSQLFFLNRGAAP
jgi:hypothetical protein